MSCESFPHGRLVSERSYDIGMRKHTLYRRLFAASVGGNPNDRLAFFCW